MIRQLEKKNASGDFSYVFEPPTKDLAERIQYSKGMDGDWILRCVNRDFVQRYDDGKEVVRSTSISDALVIKCSG